MRQIFSSKGFSPDEGFRRYSRVTRSTFYDGDVLVENGEFDIALDQSLSRPISIIHILSRAKMSYRRTAGHIRTNKAGLTVIWIVRSGSVTIHRAQGTCEIGPNQAGLVDSDIPFKAVHSPREDGFYEAFQVIVPPDVFLKYLAEFENFFSVFDLEGSHQGVIDDVIDLLNRDGDRLRPATSHALGFALLTAVADHLREIQATAPLRRRISEKTLSEVESYIELHASDPGVSMDIVADCCGITSRYLRYLLKARNTTFSEMLWDLRLNRAFQMLESVDNKALSVKKIAMMSGFKSASHFSRAYRRAYGCTPRQTRAARAG